MKLKDSVVTILLPIYNAGNFLPECLESLKSQSYKDLQIIAIDDHSKDNSYDLLKKFKKQIKGLEVYRNKKRYGPAVCYNRALRVAKGSFIAFMNPFDMSSPSRFKRQVSFLMKNPNVVAVGTQYTTITENNKKLEKSTMPNEHEEIYDNVLQASSLHPETIMINRKLIPKDLLYFKFNKYPFVFTEVFVKLFKYGKIANITQSLYYHRDGVKRHTRKVSRKKQFLAMIKLLFTSRTNYDYRPPLRSLFTPLIKGM